MNKKDSENPIKIYESFESMNLFEPLLKGIYNAGFDKPSLIQQKAIKPILDGHDVIVQSQSGTGKTGVFAIASLQKIDNQLFEPQVLILSNTRELAEQTEKVIKSIGIYTSAKIGSIIGGKSLDDDVEKLQSGLQIISGTPGRVFDMINRKVLSTLSLKLFILDEADEMLSGNFKNQIYELYRYLPPVQIVVVSATLPTSVLDMTKLFMKNPISILVRRDELTLKGISQYYVNVEKEAYKFDTLCDLYNVLVISQTVIFSNDKEKVEHICKQLKAKDFNVSYMHSGLSQKDRDKVMDQFRNGQFRILVTTDLWGRGVDVQEIGLVINYDLPFNKESYIHRIGRSGRFARKGVAISFVTDEQMWYMKDIEQFYSTVIIEMPMNIDELM